MIPSTHMSHSYPKLQFATTRTPGQLSRAAFSQLAPRDMGDSAVVSSTGSSSYVNELTLETFNEEYMDTRDRLALKRLRGESLSARESVLLDALNKLLDQLVKPPTILTSEQKGLVDEVFRRAKTR